MLHLVTLNDTQWVGHLWPRRKDLYLTTHNIQKATNIRASGGVRTSLPSKRAAADPHLRPRGALRWALLKSANLYSVRHKMFYY